jgi:hypothetical protein
MKPVLDKEVEAIKKWWVLKHKSHWSTIWCPFATAKLVMHKPYHLPRAIFT